MNYHGDDMVGVEGRLLAGANEDRNQLDDPSVLLASQGISQRESPKIPQLFLETKSCKKGRMIKLHFKKKAREMPSSRARGLVQSRESDFSARGLLQAKMVPALSKSDSCIDSMYCSKELTGSLNLNAEQLHTSESPRTSPLLDRMRCSATASTVSERSSSDFDEISLAAPSLPPAPVILVEEAPPPPSYESVTQKKATADTEAPPPPSYIDVTRDRSFLEDAPPDYHDLFAQSLSRIMDLASDSMNVGPERQPESCLHQVLILLAAPFIFLFLIFVTLMLPVTMIAVGANNIHNCPAQPRIPVFLISLGGFQMLEFSVRLIYFISKKLRHPDQQRQNRHRSKDPFIYFIVIWFVVGSMWVYQNYPSCVIVDDHPLQRTYSTNQDALSLVKSVNDRMHHSVRVQNRNGKATAAPVELPHGRVIGRQLTTGVGKLFTATVKKPSSYVQPKATEPNPMRQNTMIHSTAMPNTRARRRRNIAQNATYQLATNKHSHVAVTTRIPRPELKAACCGKTVYFMTFCIISIYYGIFGLLFLVHICSLCYRTVNRVCVSGG